MHKGCPRGPRCQGRTRRGVPQAGPTDDGPFGGGGGHGDLLENREAAAQTRADHTTAFRQSTRRPAARFPASACPGAVEHRGGFDRAGSSAPGAESRSWPCGGCRSCGWISGLDAGGWSAPAAAVVRCRCPLLHQPRSHRGWRRPFPRHMAKVGSMPAPARSAAATCSAASFTRVTPSQPDQSWLPRPPAAWRPVGAPCRGLLIRAATRVLVPSGKLKPAWAAS